MSKFIVIYQGSFCILDNVLKFPNSWELRYLLKSPEFHLNQPVDFFSNLTFWSRTYSESPQNSRSYDILHVYVVSILAANFYKNQVYNFKLSSLYRKCIWLKELVQLTGRPAEPMHRVIKVSCCLVCYRCGDFEKLILKKRI